MGAIEKKCIIIVDNSNIWIEGKKFSAKKKGINNGDDPSWRIDFGKLLATVAEEQKIKEAILVGSRPPKNDSLWKAATENGFEVIIYDRNYAGKEKSVDTEIVAKGTEIICTATEPCTLKLLSGDSDFVPLINMASKKDWDTQMWAFSNAFNENGAMAQSVTNIKPLDNVFDEIGRFEFDWPTK